MLANDGARCTRRALLAGVAGLAGLAATGLPMRRALAQSAPHTARFDAIDAMFLSDGTMSFPLSFALPGRDEKEVAAEFAAAGLPTDGILAQVNVSVLKTAGATILVDTGGGTDFMPSVGKLADALEPAGIAPAAVTHVVFTHAHADHLWGVEDPLEGATRFPNARHIIARREFDYWTAAGRENDVPDMFKTMAIGSARRLKALADRFTFVEDGAEIVPGVAVMATPGHTPGHISILAGSGTDRLLVGGDALTHPLVSFAHPDWRWGSDMEPDAAAKTRARVLDMLAADKTRLLGYHLPWPGLGRVERRGTAFTYVAG